MRFFLISFCSLFFLAGCDLGKKMTVERGHPASEEEFNAAAAKAYSGITALDQQVGDYARRGNYVRYLTAQGPQETLRSVEGRNVIGREEFEEFVLFTYYVEHVVFDGDTSQTTATEETDAYPWPASEPNLDSEELQLFSAEPAVYNLSLTETTMDAPQAVQQSTGCQGSNCRLRVRIVKFDTFATTAEGEKRIQHEYWISPDVPFVAHELKRCMSYSAQMEAVFVVITECLEVDDFRKGV